MNQTPSSPAPATARLLRAARHPADATPDIPTLHERRMEGIEAAQRLLDRPRPR